MWSVWAQRPTRKLSHEDEENQRGTGNLRVAGIMSSVFLLWNVFPYWYYCMTNISKICYQTFQQCCDLNGEQAWSTVHLFLMWTRKGLPAAGTLQMSSGQERKSFLESAISISLPLSLYPQHSSRSVSHSLDHFPLSPFPKHPSRPQTLFVMRSFVKSK